MSSKKGVRNPFFDLSSLTRPGRNPDCPDHLGRDAVLLEKNLDLHVLPVHGTPRDVSEALNGIKVSDTFIRTTSRHLVAQTTLCPNQYRGDMNPRDQDHTHQNDGPNQATSSGEADS